MGTQNRGQLAHFIAAAGKSTYDRLAKGFTDMASNLNPQTREVTYIDDSSDSTTTGFQPSWPVSGDVYTDNKANVLLYDLSVNRAKGDAAVVELLVARMWEESETASGVYKGYKQKTTWVPDSDGGGAGGETVTFSGNLNAKGDPVMGWITIVPGVGGAEATATFSETEPTP